MMSVDSFPSLNLKIISQEPGFENKNGGIKNGKVTEEASSDEGQNVWCGQSLFWY